MSSAEESVRQTFTDFKISGHSRAHVGNHYGDKNYYHSSRERSASPVGPFSNVPFPRDPDYVDRPSVSEEIHSRLKPGARLALVGLGGVGKSQLAIEAAYQVQTRSPDTYVFWLFASSRTRLEQSIKETLEQLQAPGVNESTANVFELLRAWLLDRRQQRSWLIVLDNADDAEVLLRPPDECRVARIEDHPQQAGRAERCLGFLPYCEHGSLLVTSRSKAVALEVVYPNDIVDIKPMDEIDALALLRQKLGKDLDTVQDDLVQLVAELGFMPLAMTQAAAYIRENAPRSSVKHYLEELSRCKFSLPNHDAPDLRRDAAAQNCILKTLQISFESIRQSRSSAADLLALMSFCDRHAIPEMPTHRRHLEQDPISTNELSTASTESHSPHSSIRKSIKRFFKRQDVAKARIQTTQKDQRHIKCDPSAHPDRLNQAKTQAETNFDQHLDTFDNDLQVLRSYSLITITTDPSTFEMYRLVQLATQDWLKVSGFFQRWGMQFVTNLDEGFPTYDSNGYLQHTDTCSRLYPHTVAAMGIDLDDLGSILRQANVVERGGLYAAHLGKYTDSLQMSSLALDSRSKVLGPQDPDTLKVMRLTSMNYHSLRQYEKAKSLHTEILHQYERLYGRHHRRTLQVMHELGQTYGQM